MLADDRARVGARTPGGRFTEIRPDLEAHRWLDPALDAAAARAPEVAARAAKRKAFELATRGH
ncbi:hypothetical protein [Candidatus Palauibacter sp.]|uniref:hypothetical protein n=1 Tax=Candidatus Palauibacter sp. TaxID=3101350 RepID=UPI003B02AD4A